MPQSTTNLGLPLFEAGDNAENWCKGINFAGNADSAFKKIDQFAGNVTPLKVTNVSPTFAADSTYADYAYKGTIAVPGATSAMRPEVVFGLTEALSGNYAPICESGTDSVYIYAKVNTAITIPSVVVYKE